MLLRIRRYEYLYCGPSLGSGCRLDDHTHCRSTSLGRVGMMIIRPQTIPKVSSMPNEASGL